MAFVTLNNTGQTFYVEEHESILDAAIRADVPLDYGCSNGKCGLCKARVVRGEVQPCRAFEHVISEAEKFQGYALMCSHTCVMDVEILTDQLITNRQVPVQTIEVKVKKIQPLDDDVIAVTVQTPRTQRLRFAAGQYVEIQKEGSTGQLSIASCPCDDRLIDFHLRLLANEPLCDKLLSRLKLGSSLKIRGPYGEPVFERVPSRPRLFVAFDTGFAAVKSVIEHILSQDDEARIYLIWISCRKQAYMSNLCRTWSDAFDGFQYSTLVIPSDTQHGQHQDILLMISAQLGSLLQTMKTVETSAYVVAPEPMQKIICSQLQVAGVSADSIQCESVRGNLYARCEDVTGCKEVVS